MPGPIQGPSGRVAQVVVVWIILNGEGGHRVQTAKQEVQQLLDELPDDTTFEDIQYHLYVKQTIAQGLADVAAGRVVPQEEIEQRFAKWLVR